MCESAILLRDEHIQSHIIYWQLNSVWYFSNNGFVNSHIFF